MAEDKKNLSPDSENEPVKAPDETISELSDALEKKLHENENDNVPPEKAPEPTDDDVLAEIKEALDKAENSEDENDILSGKAADDRFERISEEDFKLPDTDDVGQDTKAADEISRSADREAEQAKSSWQSKTAAAPSKRQSSDSAPDGKATRAKKSSPTKIILFILAFIAVGIAAFALVHYVITPNMANGGGSDSSSRSEATKDELETIAPTESAHAMKANDTMKNMSRREKICQLFMVTPEVLMNSETPVTAADNSTKDALGNYPVGGVIFTQQNLTGEDQAKALVSGTQDDSKIPLFIAVDDDAIISTATPGAPQGGPGNAPQGGPEGGPGNTPGNGPQGGPGNGGPQGGPEGQQAPTEKDKDTSPDGAYEEAYTTSQQKHDVGFNLDFTLDADASEAKENNPELTDTEAGTLLSSAVKGCNEGGVIPSLKYFPGKQDTDSSDTGFVHITKSTEDLDTSTEFGLFRSGIEAGAGMIMVNHVYVDKLDTEKPATLSDKVVPQLLREKLNYQGVVVTGNMSADFFTREYKYSTIVKGIFASDIDLILNPNSIQSYVQEIEGLLDSGEITEAQLDAKVKRILTLKYQSGVISDSDNAAAASEATTASTEATAETTTETTAATVVTDSTTAPAA